MSRRVAIVLFGLVAIALAPARAADRWWVGGGIGIGFGDLTYVSIEPTVGYSVTPQFGVGARLIYRYTEDDRYDPGLSTNDYGGSLFARYHVMRPVFLQAEYEYLSYEIGYFDGTTERDDYGSWLAGAGVSQTLGGHASLFVLAMYNFSYSSDEPSPYDDPWVIRVGVGFGF